MTKNNKDIGTRSSALSRKNAEVYQRVTGNEGPSPLMKRDLNLRSRQKRQSVQPVGNEFGKSR